MRGNLPEGWRIDSVMSVFSVVSGKTPSTKVEKYWKDGDIEWITPADMSDVNEHVYLVESSRKVSKSALMETGLNLVPKDTIILSTRAPVGTLALSSKEMTFNQGCHGLINRDPSLYDTRYFYYYLLGKRWDLQNQSGGSTFKELSKERLNSFPLLIPPLAEQRRIAGILTSADSAIEDADKAVFESQRIKTGLMQQLIPRDTENLPEGWTLGKLDDAGTWSAGGTPSRTKPEYYLNGTVPWIKSGDLNDGYVTETEEKITLAATKETRACINKIGSVALALYGATIGKTGIISVEAATNQACCVCTPYSHIDSRFLNAYLISQRNEFRKRGSGGAQSNISKEIVVSYPFPYPPLAEQRRIAEILSAADEQIALCQKRKALLQRTKTGLMQNLLSGAAS